MRHSAMLLLGPTGSGKTPLGDVTAARGLWGRPAVHFDFGDQLRRVVRRDRPDETISRADIDFLRGVLESGALLEDEQFPLAARLLKSFLGEQPLDDRTLVALNGLPRHVGQAEAIETTLHVCAVVHLRCDEATVLARIANNAGGDRTDRIDDDRAAVRNKLAVFRQRTAPLLDHYRRGAIPIHEIDVAADMSPERMWRDLEARRDE